MKKKVVISFILILLMLLSSSNVVGWTGTWRYVGKHGIVADEARSFVLVNESGSYVINIGGASAVGNQVWRTDIATGESIQLGTLLAKIYQEGMVYSPVNHTAWIMGGYFPPVTNVIWGFSFDNNTCWNTGATMPVSAMKWSRNGVWYDGIAYTFGGYAGASLGYVVAYNPSNNTAWHEHTLGHPDGIRTPGVWYDGYSDTCYVAGGADDSGGHGYIDEIRAYCFTNNSDWIVGYFTRETPSSIRACWNYVNQTWIAGPSPTADDTGCNNISVFDPATGWVEEQINEYPPCVGVDCLFADAGTDNSSAEKHFYFFLGDCGANQTIWELELNVTDESDVQFVSIDGGSNGTTIYNSTPVFVWTKADDAIQYHLQISTTSDFSSLTVNLSDINEVNYPSEYYEATNVTFVLPDSNALPNFGLYYCRVRAYV